MKGNIMNTNIIPYFVEEKTPSRPLLSRRSICRSMQIS